MILAILQARCSSSRLPGKVMKPILGKPMLAMQIERIMRATMFDKLIVATSSEPSDDSIAALCLKIQVPCFRGSLTDVLDRFYQAALPMRPDHIVRLTGDCPLADPEMIDRLIRFYLDGDYDYANNCLEPTFPDGLDVEIFRYSCLEIMWREATLPSEREHVTGFVDNHRDRFRIGVLRGNIDLSALRWTVDEPEDFELVSRIYEALHPTNPHFSTKDILAYLDLHPELNELNAHHIRDAGYLESLKRDALFLEAKRKLL